MVDSARFASKTPFPQGGKTRLRLNVVRTRHGDPHPHAAVAGLRRIFRADAAGCLDGALRETAASSPNQDSAAGQSKPASTNRRAARRTAKPTSASKAQTSRGSSWDAEAHTRNPDGPRKMRFPAPTRRFVEAGLFWHTASAWAERKLFGRGEVAFAGADGQTARRARRDPDGDFAPGPVVRGA